jgi:hypothetical protein
MNPKTVLVEEVREDAGVLDLGMLQYKEVERRLLWHL